MNPESPQARAQAWWLLLLRLGLLTIGGYLLWRSRTIITTVVLALVLASAVSAVVDPLCRVMRFIRPPHLRRSLATLLVFIGLALCLAFAVRSLLRPFQVESAELARNWPSYQKQILQTIDQVRERYADLPPGVRDYLEKRQAKGEMPDVGIVTGLLGTTISWASHLIELILLPILAFYFVVDGRSLRNEFLRYLPRHHLRTTLAIITECTAIMRAYLVAQFLLALIAGVVVGVGLGLLGMKYAVILGIIAGVTRAVPVIGPLLGGVPVGVLAFVQSTQNHDYAQFFGIITGFTILHLIESKLIMPQFLGSRLHLHAVLIIIALLLGGEFFGLMGMFLAVPTAALLRVLLMHYFVYPRRPPQRPGRRGTSRPRLARALRLRLFTPPVPTDVGPSLTASKDR
jgi:predicted PurR-regulated permease PerM